MPCPISTVTFPSGSLEETANVSAIAQHGDDFIVVATRTPFHPRDYQWPDQPEDRGYIAGPDGKRYGLSDSVFVAVDPDGVFSVDDEISAKNVKKNTPGWGFVVGHVLHGERPSLVVGDEITLHVDELRRSQLSRPHSAAHLMSLALNRALAPLWRKEPPSLDALGSQNFDQAAIERSKIDIMTSIDTYRIGKSIRKKGFTPQDLADNLDKYMDTVNSQLAAWVDADAPVSIRTEGEHLISHRYWRTNIEGTDVEIPCGGTAVSGLSEIGTINVEAEIAEGDASMTLTIKTYVR